MERAQWLEYERSPRRTVGATLNYIAAVLLILATCAMALVGCSGPSDLEAERASAAALQDAIAQAQAERDAAIAASRATQSPDDEILQSIGATAEPPHRAMGIDPAAGPLSAPSSRA